MGALTEKNKVKERPWALFRAQNEFFVNNKLPKERPLIIFLAFYGPKKDHFYNNMRLSFDFSSYNPLKMATFHIYLHWFKWRTHIFYRLHGNNSKSGWLTYGTHKNVRFWCQLPSKAKLHGMCKVSERAPRYRKSAQGALSAQNVFFSKPQFSERAPWALFRKITVVLAISVIIVAHNNTRSDFMLKIRSLVSYSVP